MLGYFLGSPRIAGNLLQHTISQKTIKVRLCNALL